MGGLSVLNLALNNLGELVLPQGWSEDWKDDCSAKEYTHTDGSKQDQHPGKPEGIIALANAIPDMGAMTKFDISSNDIMAEGGEALADGLKGNQVIKELNFSGNKLGYNSSGNNETSGIIAIADVIPGMGALSVADVLGNKIGKEQLAKLQEIMRAKPNLVSLCGIADDATEADLSGLGMDADDAIVLASELPDKRALSSLNLASNDLKAEDAKIIMQAVTVLCSCGLPYLTTRCFVCLFNRQSWLLLTLKTMEYRLPASSLVYLSILG
jgi:hypothetical protein